MSDALTDLEEYKHWCRVVGIPDYTAARLVARFQRIGALPQAMIDGAARSSTARVKEAAELSIIDHRKFRFVVDEVPNFAIYVMGAMARRIRGMGQVM